MAPEEAPLPLEPEPIDPAFEPVVPVLLVPDVPEFKLLPDVPGLKELLVFAPADVSVPVPVLPAVLPVPPAPAPPPPAPPPPPPCARASVLVNASAVAKAIVPSFICFPFVRARTTAAMIRSFRRNSNLHNETTAAPTFQSEHSTEQQSSGYRIDRSFGATRRARPETYGEASAIFRVIATRSADQLSCAIACRVTCPGRNDQVAGCRTKTLDDINLGSEIALNKTLERGLGIPWRTLRHAPSLAPT
jgi:hypothetical protein